MKIFRVTFYLILSCIYLANTPISYAAYLIVSNDKKIVEKNDYKKAWEIINQYAFPQRLALQENMHLNITNEQEYVQVLIEKNVNPNLKLVFIPDTIYELYVMSVAHNYNDIFNKLKSQIFTVDFKGHDLSKEAYFKLHSNESIIDLAYKINNSLATEVEGFINRNAVVDKVHYETFINKFCEQLRQNNEYRRKNRNAFDGVRVMYIVTIPVGDDDKIYNEDIKAVLIELSKLQLKAHRENEMILLRGSSGISSKVKKEIDLKDSSGISSVVRYISSPDSPLRLENEEDLFLSRNELVSPNFSKKENYNKLLNIYSYSFGNSLFAGIFRDPGACAYKYFFSGKPKYGYYLRVSKTDGALDELFFIAPLHPLLGLIGEGEYFHSRTKLPNLSGKIVGLYPRYRSDIPSFLYFSENYKHKKNEFYVKLGKFFQRHFHLLTFEGSLPKENNIALKVKRELDDQIQRDFDLLFLTEEAIDKQRKINEEIRNKK